MCVYVCIYVRTYVMSVYVCTYVCNVCVCVYVCMYVCNVCVCVYVCMYVHVCMYVRMQCMYVCMYARAHERTLTHLSHPMSLAAGWTGDRIPVWTRYSMPSRPASRPTQPLYHGYRIFPGSKRAGTWC